MSRQAWRQPNKASGAITQRRTKAASPWVLAATILICASPSGCAHWAQLRKPVSKSDTNSDPQGAANLTRATDATSAASSHSQVEQLADEVQQYVNRLPLDDVQAKLARHSEPDLTSPPAYVLPGKPAKSATDQFAELAPNRLVVTPVDSRPSLQTAEVQEPSTSGQPDAVEPASPAQMTRIIEVDIAPAAQMTQPARRMFPSVPAPMANQPAPNEAGDSPWSRELQELLDRFRAEALNRPDSMGAALRLRLAQWLLNNRGVAPEDWPLKDADKRQLAEATWQVLQAVAEAETTDPATSIDDLTRAADALADILAELQPLRIPFAALCRSVSSFGCFEALPEPVRFSAGRTHLVVLYYELAGFRSERSKEKPGWYRTLLSQQLAILTTSGQRLWSHEDVQVEDLCRRPRRDFFVTRILKIPSDLLAGRYVLKITVQDRLAKTVTETNVPFEITTDDRASTNSD